jgi:hypothetical protein
VWRSQSFGSSWWFFLPGISSISPRFYFRKHAFCFLPLVATLESSPLVFFICGTRVWTQGFVHARQALYHLSHALVLFVLLIF